MSTWIYPPIAGLIEVTVAPEIYFDDIGSIEVCGGIARIACYANEMSINGFGIQKSVKVWLRRPMAVTPTILGKLAIMNEFQVLGRQMPTGPFAPHLVR